MRPRHGITMFVMVLVAGGLLSVRSVGAQAPDPSGSASSAPPPAAYPDLQTVSPPRGGSLEQERTPGVGPRIHEPVFLEPATATTEHTRLGPSAWIAPGAPFDHRENPGGV